MTREIAKALANIIIEAALNLFERAHHINLITKREEALFLVTKIRFWDTSEELKPAFIKANKSGTPRVVVCQIYLNALPIRRNEALKL